MYMNNLANAVFFLIARFLFFCRVFENGKETIMSYENDVLKSKTVNGVPQSITYS